MNDPVLGLANGVETLAIPAREPSGEVVDAREKVKEALEKCQETRKVPIVHSVYGSKTGICQPFQIDLKDKVEKLGGIFVVDACQGRFEIDWLGDLLRVIFWSLMYQLLIFGVLSFDVSIGSIIID